MKGKIVILSSMLLHALIVMILTGCGGSGNSSGANGSPQKNINILASIKSGGATELDLSNGKIYFADYNRGAIYSVPASGGEIMGHYTGGYSPGRVIHAGGKIFFRSGGLYSLPDNTEGFMTLFEAAAYQSQDIANDGTYVYWATGSTIIRTAAVPTSDSTTDMFFKGDPQGFVRLALDGINLFVSDSKTGNIYRINTVDGKSLQLTSSMGTGIIPLAVTSSYLYALLDNRNIVQINKVDGTNSVVASNYMQYDTIKADADAVYWWQSDASKLYLKRLNSATGQVASIASIPFPWDFFTFYSDGMHVYWCIGIPNAIGDLQLYMQRVPVSGGSIETIATFDAYLGTNNGMAPHFLTADEDFLYWTSMAINALIKLPKTGGTPIIVTQQVGYGGPVITLLGDNIYLGDSDGIHKVPKIGQTEPTVERSQMVNALAADTSNVYWSAGSDIYSKPVTTGIVQKISSVNGFILKMFPYEDWLFLLKSTASGWVISVIPIIGGTEEELIVDILDEPSDIFIHKDILYILLDGVYACDLNTGDINTLLEYRSGVKRLYVDDSYVYWTESYDGGGGAVSRIHLSGGTPEYLNSGKPAWAIAGDSEKIYWAGMWNIFSMDK